MDFSWQWEYFDPGQEKVVAVNNGSDKGSPGLSRPDLCPRGKAVEPVPSVEDCFGLGDDALCGTGERRPVPIRTFHV